MNFFETFTQGIAGLILFFGNWISPESDRAGIFPESIDKSNKTEYRVTVSIKTSFNRQMEELIDAGIPLNFRFLAVTDKNDTTFCFRSLRCNVADLTYFFRDSTNDMIYHSKTFPMVIMALKEYCRWSFAIPLKARICKAEAEILYSRVSQFDRYLDLSRIWGHHRITTTFELDRGKK